DHHGQEGRIYCYNVNVVEVQRSESGRQGLELGHVDLCSRITQESAEFTYGVLHFGDHNINAGVRHFQGEDAYHNSGNEISQSFNHADLAESLRLLDKHFGGAEYTLKSLFRDEQRRIVSE